MGEAQVPVVGTAHQVLNCRCVVGESLIWDDSLGLLIWVDMLGQHIHMYDPVTQDHGRYDTPGMVTSIGMRKDGGYIVGLERSVALWSPNGVFTPLATPEPDLPDNRLNEGVVGPDGCFWVGTMQNNVDASGTPRDQTEATGQVWRIHPDGRSERMLGAGFWLTNTIAWIGESVIIGDTGRNMLFQFAQRQDRTALTDKQIFLAGYDAGLPDGSCVDAHDHLWNCRVVGGAEVLCLDADGTPLRKVTTPCTWPTSCVFGGPDLDTLFVASARFTMSDAHLAAAPWEGNLFSCTLPDVTGRLHHKFG